MSRLQILVRASVVFALALLVSPVGFAAGARLFKIVSEVLRVTQIPRKLRKPRRAKSGSTTKKRDRRRKPD